jgi:hypothetical protein
VEPSDLLRRVADTLGILGVRYAVVGSMASTLYGDLRITNDIDVVIDLPLEKVQAFCAEFPDPEFYLSRPAVESAVRKRFQFNIIHPSSGLKVDCFIVGSEAFDQQQLTRAVATPREGGAYVVRFAAPEDVIIKKLEYFRLGGSEKHIRDICGMLKAQGDRIDRDYIQEWAGEMGLTEIWKAVLARLAAG